MRKENVVGQNMTSESKLISLNNTHLNNQREKKIVDRDILEMIYGRNSIDSLQISDKWRTIVEILMETAYT